MKKLIIATILLLTTLNSQAQAKFYFGSSLNVASTSTLTKAGGGSFTKNQSLEQGVFLQYYLPAKDDRTRMSLKLTADMFQRLGGVEDNGTSLKVTSDVFRPSLSMFTHMGRRGNDGTFLFDFMMGLGYFLSIPSDQKFEGSVLIEKYVGKTDQYMNHGLMAQMGVGLYLMKNIRIDLGIHLSADLGSIISNKDKAVPVRYSAAGINVGVAIPLVKGLLKKELPKEKKRKV